MPFDAIQKIRQVVASYDLLRYLHVAKLCCETWAKEHQNAGLVVPGRPSAALCLADCPSFCETMDYDIISHIHIYGILMNFIDLFVYLSIYLSIYLPTYLSIHPKSSLQFFSEPRLVQLMSRPWRRFEVLCLISTKEKPRRETEKPGHLRYFGNFLAMEAMVHW